MVKGWAATSNRMKINVSWIMVLLLPTPGFGQTSTGSAQDSARQGVPDPGGSSPLTSFLDDIFQNPRNHLGFSLGAHQAYVSNLYVVQPGARQDASVTSASAQIFTNFGESRTLFHLDYRAAYRFYNNQNGLDAFAQAANATFRRELSRRVSFSASDFFYSAPNDFNLFWGAGGGGGLYVPDFANDVLYPRQRVTRNSLRGALAFRLSRKASLSTFAGYHIFNYENRELGNSTATNVGLSFDYEITGWMRFSTYYSVYLNNPQDRFRDTQIHRLNVGAFTFRLSRAWRLNLGGGLDIADTTDRTRLGARANAVLTRLSPSNTFTLSYHHGLSNTLGFPGIFESDHAGVDFSQRLTAWMNWRLSGLYNRSTYRSGPGSYEYYAAGTVLDFALKPNLIASLGGSYWDQTQRGLSPALMNMSRYAVYASLQFVWPGSHR